MTRTVGLITLLLLALVSSAIAAPKFDPRPCAASLPAKSVRCGVVVVPESENTGRTIALNVVIVPALKKKIDSAPLFHLEGGPGIAATNVAGFYFGPGSAYRTSRDVVLVDQRGSGESNPLRCDALEHRSPLEDMYSASDVSACRALLESKADLLSYTTDRAAGDIDDVRRALGYSKIDIWAVSYGTRLAQVYMKRFPSRVAHAVLVGFVPLDYRTPLFHALNAQRAMDLLEYKCQREDDCSRRYPDFRSEWTSVLDTLRHAPAGQIRPGPFAEAVRTLMGTAAGQRALPAMIHAAAGGDFGPFLKQVPKDSSQFADGVYLSIVCPEAVSRIKEDDVDRDSRGTFLGDYRVRQEMAACAEWPRKQFDESFFTPPKSTAPILILDGEMDQVAAPEWGRDFCATLANCRYVQIDDMGHGPFDLDAWTNGSCFDDIAVAFYVHSTAVDVSCLKTMRPPKFK